MSGELRQARSEVESGAHRQVHTASLYSGCLTACLPAGPNACLPCCVGGFAVSLAMASQ